MTFLDTSVIIDFLKGDEKIVAIVRELYEKQDLKTTAINEYELLKYGAELKRQAAEKFLVRVTVCSFDRASAEKAASLYRKLCDDGKMINENDLLIAGIALANNEGLLTRDQKFSNLGEESIKIV